MPRKRNPEPLVKVTIRLPEGVVTQLRVLNPDLSAAEVIRLQIKAYLNRVAQDAAADLSVKELLR